MGLNSSFTGIFKACLNVRCEYMYIDECFKNFLVGITRRVSLKVLI